MAGGAGPLRRSEVQRRDLLRLESSSVPTLARYPGIVETLLATSLRRRLETHALTNAVGRDVTSYVSTKVLHGRDVMAKCPGSRYSIAKLSVALAVRAWSLTASRSRARSAVRIATGSTGASPCRDLAMPPLAF